MPLNRAALNLTVMSTFAIVDQHQGVMAAKEVCGGRWCERGPGGICEGLGEFVVLRRRVGPWSDSTVGLVSRLPSRMCWVGVLCCGISFLGRLGAGDASCWHEVLRRARSCWSRGRRGLPLHMLGNDGGRRRARGTSSRERSVVLKGATSSTRSVGEGW